MMNKFLQFLSLTKKSGNLIEGYNKCEEALKKKKLYLLIISSDVSENTRSKFKYYCEERQIPYLIGHNKYELGVCIGREEISILGVSDENMAAKLISLFNVTKIN